MSANELIERTNQRLGGVQSPMMEGDNLAILLCTYFENPDQECEDDICWTPDSIKGQEEVLDAIRAHYQPMADLLASQAAEIERLEVNAIHSCHDQCTRPLCVLRRENEKLREALEPFAQAASTMATWAEDHHRLSAYPGHTQGLTAGDLRRAHQALKGTGADHG